MNNKLPRLVLVGAGTIAVAVLSAFSGRISRLAPSGPSIDTDGYEVACGGIGERPCQRPTGGNPASAVRG